MNRSKYLTDSLKAKGEKKFKPKFIRVRKEKSLNFDTPLCILNDNICLLICMILRWYFLFVCNGPSGAGANLKQIVIIRVNVTDDHPPILMPLEPGSKNFE